MKESQKNLLIILIISALTVAGWQFETGRLILYPFTVLGTWFHEMGHGLAALVLGGNFHQLVINSNGSGYAQWSGDLFLGNVGKAIVAAFGPIGPTIAGSIFIISSKDEKWTKWALIVLAVLLLISGFYWVRSWFGTPVVLFFGLLSAFVVYQGSSKFQKYTVLFLGVQACLSVYLSIDYLFMPLANVTGEDQLSDTNVISTFLFLPHWFWGGLIIFISVIAIWKSLKYALK